MKIKILCNLKKSCGSTLKRGGVNLREYCSQLDERGIDLRKYTRLFKTIAFALAISFIFDPVALGMPTTGYTPLDNGAWKIVKGFQAVIFWGSLLYSLKELLTILVRKTGEWKELIVGFIVCVLSYAAPAIWGAVPKLFQ